MDRYDPKKIEGKWQKRWEKEKLYRAVSKSKKRKYYALVEFPYPSGDGLHVGHVRSYTALDVIARKRRAEGYNVLYPMGWDAFGLPTENYAIKTGTPPAVVTQKNTTNFRRQLKALGFSFDWSREINTTDPHYYRWTQWLFLQFFKKGLAYKTKIPINWCPSCKIGLANEEVKDDKCERCGAGVEMKEREQWMLAITQYADRLERDLEKLDFPERIKIQQRNWIGKKEGVEIKFGGIKIFTTRPETIFGATFIARAGKQDRFTGQYAINPVTDEKIPIWEAEYVMGEVGTGAIMGVPAHDDRDFDFAKKHNLPIKEVVGDGVLKNSGRFDGRDSEEARDEIIKFVGGKKVTTYKLRDWVFSRQRYWGEPIPLVYCENCAEWVAVPDEDLPVKLPPVKNYLPTDTGESPLAKIEKWVKAECPKCGGPARRETDTMPNWAGSSWYYLAYAANSKVKSQRSKLKVKGQKFINFRSDFKSWLPVDWYNGGMEHTTLHLLYSRFWHKFLYDQKLVPTSEPYKKRTSHGLVLAYDGQKMSKSRGNVINPDEIVKRFGADTLRVYEMFMGPFEQEIAWNDGAVGGAKRFLERVWKLAQKVKTQKSKVKNESQKLNETVRKVTEDIEAMKFNTAISALMILLNDWEKNPQISVRDFKIFLQLLAPFAPHLASELWMEMGEKKLIDLATWPRAKKIKAASRVKIAIQINGKTRGQIEVDTGLAEDEISNQAKAEPTIAKWLNGRELKRQIYVPNRLLNFMLD